MRFAHRIMAAALACSPAIAQNTRHVTEPRIPENCAVLTARLAAPGGVLPVAGERQPDIERIQRAIDSCARGKAVELKPEGARNI